MKATKLKMTNRGRPRIGPTACIALTAEQHAWLEAQIPPGGSLSAVVRSLVQAAMAAEPAKRRART